jgi:hypothetical protein
LHQRFFVAIDFTVKDVPHKVTAKLTPAYLPEVKKPYNLRAVLQSELDGNAKRSAWHLLAFLHGVASKAEVYNIEADPRMIEEGFNAACDGTPKGTKHLLAFPSSIT